MQIEYRPVSPAGDHTVEMEVAFCVQGVTQHSRINSVRKLEQYASWLGREWPSAAASLREGLSELFTVNRLGLPKPLRRCVTTTNVIDSSHAGVRQHTNRVSRWQSEEMAVRWAAVTVRETEKHYRRITGYEHLWMLKAHLDEEGGVLTEFRRRANVCLLLPTFNYRRDTLLRSSPRRSRTACCSSG